MVTVVTAVAKNRTSAALAVARSGKGRFADYFYLPRTLPTVSVSSHCHSLSFSSHRD